MKWIGLTGGIATGKSTASRFLSQAGEAVVDADQLAREAVAAGSPGIAQIAQAFGQGVLTASGELDRKKMGELVFSEPKALATLEAILHPAIRSKCLEAKRELERSGRDLAFYDVPLLFEKSMEAEFDATIAVVCALDKQKQRLMARDSLSSEQAEARLASQLPLAEKARRAAVTVTNDGSVEELRKKIVEVAARLRKA